MDKKQISFRIEPAVIKKLKFLAVEQDRTLTSIIMEALQDVLRKYESKKK
jgi:predicted transcriptional regulator